MKKYGTTQRRYGEARPQVYDKATRKVCVDIQPCELTQQNNETGEEETIEGYSWIEVYLGDGSLDYSSVKSKLIEAGYPPKDEFGFLMNAMAAVIEGDTESEKITEFWEFNEWRTICAAAAKEVCAAAGTILPQE